MRRYFLTVLLVILAGNVFAQNYAQHLKISDAAAYLGELKHDPQKQLVEIKKYIPGIVLDIRYATTNNFTHYKMYPQAKAFARLPVVMALQKVEADLAKQGLGLKIYDAYRPYSVTVKFYQLVSDTNFVANPGKGSKHNRGCAVDLSVIDLKSGKELNMPTWFDSFSKKASANYPYLTREQLHNRSLLKEVMQAHGFTQLPSEWWHFDYNGWKSYELLDVPFSAIPN